jgi:outer membrane protein OmpA-like peptidoglycan-associated protein
VLVAYVAVGVNRTNVPVAAEPTASPTAAPTTATQVPAPVPTTPKPSPSSSGPKVTFNEGNNTFTVNDLLFELNSAKLKPEARASLAEIVTKVRREHRLGTLVVTGYTDDSGSPAFNAALSTRRASAVATYLRTHLGSAYRVKAFGKGDLDPLKPNTTEANRTRNRRVEVVVPPARTATPSQTPTSATTAPTAT